MLQLKGKIASLFSYSIVRYKDIENRVKYTARPISGII